MRKYNLDKLLHGLRIKDPLVLRSIYKDYYPKVLGYVLNHGGSDDDAKDIFQETIITVYKLIDDSAFEIETGFENFIMGIAKRLLLKHHRNTVIHDKYVNQTDHEYLEDHPSEAVLEGEVEMQLIRKHIANLGEDCRKILMWAAEGINNTKIAKKMAYKSEKTVRTKKYKCKTHLLEMIKSDPNYTDR